MIRILIADDHQIVRTGLTALLDVNDDITIVGTVANGAEAVEAYTQFAPDVVLMDLSMPTMDGITATRAILARDPAARVVILTSFSDRARVSDAISAGASGYVLKDAEPDTFAPAIRAAAAGGSPLDPRVAATVLGSVRSHNTPELSQRELEVLLLVTRGMLNKQIARELGITEKTVKAHLSKVYGRLGVSDRTQAALWAQRNGLFDQEP
ncbi:MAG: response regulator transcription factor [Actinomycetes bacterium]